MTSHQIVKVFFLIQCDQKRARVKETEQKMKKSNYPILLAPLNLTHFKKWRQFENSLLVWPYHTDNNFIRISALQIGGKVVKSEYKCKETVFYHILFVVKK